MQAITEGSSCESIPVGFTDIAEMCSSNILSMRLMEERRNSVS